MSNVRHMVRFIYWKIFIHETIRSIGTFPLRFAFLSMNFYNGPLARYVKMWVAHASGMPGTFSLPPTSNETTSWRPRHASRHVRHARAVMHVGLAYSQWQRKRSRHSRRMRNPRFYLSGKRPYWMLLAVVRRDAKIVKTTLLSVVCSWWRGLQVIFVQLKRKFWNIFSMSDCVDMSALLCTCSSERWLQN